MKFHVYGPESCRHNDLTTLVLSGINEKVVELLSDSQVQYVMYGDSAYIHVRDSHVLTRFSGENLTPFEIALNRALSACRETVEWDYGNIQRLWSAVTFKATLRSRASPVGDMFLLAMILTDAHCCLYGNQTSEYFHMLPPTLTQWVQNGSRPAVVEE
jgi:nuclease HARBI1